VLFLGAAQQARRETPIGCGENPSERLSLTIISPAFAGSFVEGLKNCRLVQLSSGLHYLQEDHPDVIGANIKEWLIEVGIGSGSKQKLTF
jgi:hypothetical protein